MPSLSTYKRTLGSAGKKLGQVRKQQSDMLMEVTWDGDIQSKVCYLYDFYHDDEPGKLRNLHPENSKTKTPVDAKYIVSSYQTMDKDQVTYHLQFKPSHKCCVYYYDEVFGDKYDCIYPLGLFVDIPDNDDIYHRWLIVEKADYYAPQFSTYQILPCDYVFQWIFNGKKYEVPGVLRSQNSYNSGLWTDYKMTSIEDQQKFLVPLNEITENLWYNQRMIIDAKVSTQPRAWEISKVNRISPNGLVRVTLAQDNFDQHHDYIERDSNNKIIGMWADYYNTVVSEEDPFIKHANYYSSITYSGVKPQIKLGGSYKKFTVNFYENGGSDEIDFKKGEWKFFIKVGEEIEGGYIDASSVIQVLTESSDLKENQIKVKFTGDSSFIGQILLISYIDENNIKSFIEMEIVGL